MSRFTPHARPMRLAIDDVRRQFQALPGGPFGACIVRGEAVIAVAHNTVLAHHDPTCHAEVNAIRAASAALASHDLSGCTIYSTTEPCPMCFSAIHWARLERVVFGTRIEDVRRLGFNELTVDNATLKRLGGSPVDIIPDFLRDECLRLLDDWAALPGRQVY